MQDASGSAIMRAIERVNEGIERDPVVIAIGRPMSSLKLRADLKLRAGGRSLEA